MRARRHSGFTLVELAVVLTIVAFLLASLMYTLSAQTDQRNIDDTRRRLEQARELILSYAITKGRMPCPAYYRTAADNSSGRESFCTSAASSSLSTCVGSETMTEQTHGTCSNHFDGYVPAMSIGFLQTDASGFALDAWGNRIRYAVTRTNTNCSGAQVPPNSYTTMYTSKTYLQNYGISCQPNDLLVCKSGSGITGTDCGGASNQIMATSLVVGVVFSTGKNGAIGGAPGSAGVDEAANLNGDRVFVFHTPTPSTFANGEFDDQFTWITVGELYGKLIAGGVLP
jgi:prepilin-type N-terminal cleavage/methylation domain-containing protein